MPEVGICVGLKRQSSPKPRVRRKSALDGLDFFDLGDVCLEVSFDPHFERYLTGGATDAGTVESDLDGAFGGEVDELDVAAVGLDRGSDQVDDLLDSFADLGCDSGCGGH